MTIKKILILIVLLAAAFTLAACQGSATDATPVEVTRIVEVPAESDDMAPAVEIPFLDRWMNSGHADSTAEAFRHWDEEDPQEVPTSCAKCHSSTGYQDFIGADGSEAGVVDAAAGIDTVITCVTCHNDVTVQMTSVTMPSGIELTGLGDESRCMQCHQGRASKFDVDTAIETAGLTESPDEVSEDLGFINIHYYAATATKYGTMAKGGYEYDGKSYDGFFAHVEEFSTCIDCHDSHTLEVKVDQCAHCHDGVETAEDLYDVRMVSSAVDYDGDGDIDEGIYYEIAGLQDMLYAAMQAYSADVIGTGLIYDEHSYPYFFNDTNGDGAASEDEVAFANAYSSWTPRLVKAAYNYQVSLKDTGGFAHGGKYLIELLYDSIEDLNAGIDLSGAHRIDHGHFAGSEEAFRHWDEEGEVPASCSRCHSAEGLPLFVEQGVTINQEVSNGFQCTTCHNGEEFPNRYAVTSVTFPSGVTISSEEPQDQFLCMTCHQGRESGVSIENAVAGLPDDEPANLRFLNVHYFAAGATRYGTEVNGMYEYPGMEYDGVFTHVSPFDECTECHDAHELEVQVNACVTCHDDVEDVKDINLNSRDYDGDGEVEGIAYEVAGFKDALYAAMQDYSGTTTETIVYNAARYPYFFNEAGESYAGWTPALLKAAYNYQFVEKDPGAFAHNGHYVMQVLYDTIQDLGGDVSGMTRP